MKALSLLLAAVLVVALAGCTSVTTKAGWPPGTGEGSTQLAPGTVGSAPVTEASTGESSGRATVFGVWGDSLSQPECYEMDFAIAALALLANEDWGALGALVHPTRGLTFSPYGFVDTQTAVCLGAGDVKALGIDETVRTWGYYDGSGKPISCTFAQYYDQFIMSRDFVHAPQIGINRILKTSEGRNMNVFGKGISYVEFYIPNSAQDKEDWATLRLVFSNDTSDEYFEFYLVAIVHDQWTI